MKLYTATVASIFAALIVPTSSAQPLVDANAHDVDSTNYYQECAPVTLGEADENLNTPELIALLDQFLFDSIDQHEQCVQQLTIQSSQSGSPGGGAGQGASGDAGNSNSANNGASDKANTNQQEQNQAQAESRNNTNSGIAKKSPSLANGASNKNIEAKDNDAAVCAMLREELSTETNVEKQAQIKEIYKNYRC